MYDIKKRITKIDTTNATSIPIIRIKNSKKLNAKPNFTSFKRLAPNITGIAKKKVNSAATARLTPINKPPIIVAPDLEVPGSTAAITWNKPIINASL